MPRVFNTAGPCDPAKHYMLPAEERLSAARELIDLERYFVLHAPRQTGKTTTVAALVASLNAEGRYTSLLVSCEEAQAAGEDSDLGIDAILTRIAEEAATLPEALRPPPMESVGHVGWASRLGIYLSRWAERSPQPIVLFLDEVDSVMGKTLISVLRQLRAGYPSRPQRFPQTVALVGMRDVRDYKIAKGEVLHTASPYNIKDRSFLLPNFTAAEVATLLEQHTDDTGQLFSDDAKAGIWELTRGQPWLVNALASQLVSVEVPDPATAVEAHHLEVARDTLIERRDTHLDSLIDRLTEKRVRRVLEPILAGGMIKGSRIGDDVAFVEDLGLVARGPDRFLRIANPIYHEIIPRALVDELEDAITPQPGPFVTADGWLDMPALLDAFVDFWRENAVELLEDQVYPEIAPHLILNAFLIRLSNGGATIDREYAVGRRRMDLCVRWVHPGGIQREAIEIKVWGPRRGDPLPKGLDQLAGYLKTLDLDHGTLVIFDCRPNAPEFDQRFERLDLDHQGRRITVLRL